jgi:hypothetical protein
MGSHPTLDQTEPAAEALELNPYDWPHGHAVAHLAADHPRCGPGPTTIPTSPTTWTTRLHLRPHPPVPRAGLRPAQP